MMKNMRSGMPASLFKGGTKHVTGLQATIMRNIEACRELSNITKTSMGPNGMNKMVINHLDKLFVTSDAATIMKEMEIAHAAAKMLVMAAEMQEQEVGDGSNLVIVLGGELLHKAENLIDMGLHPSEIISGYQVAYQRLKELFEDPALVVRKLEEKDMQSEQALVKGVQTAIASKQYGQEAFLAKLVAQACLMVMPENPYNFHVESVRTVKLLGGSLAQSEVLKGMVVPYDVIGPIKDLTNARVGVYTAGIETTTTETKGTIVISDAKELMGYNESEERALEALIKSIRDCGINCIITSGSISDMGKHFLQKFGIVCIKVSSQFEMRRLCKTTGATAQVNLQPIPPEEQGFCGRVFVREIGLTKVTVFQNNEKDQTKVATILLRGSTNEILNDVERAIDDGVNVVKAMGRDGRFMAGAGAAEMELARRIGSFAETRSGLDQYAVKAFAEALEVVPRILAENAGQTALDVISQLYAAHEKGDIKVGVNIDDGGVQDMSQVGVVDHLHTKANAFRLAVDAVITILRVDQIIMSKQAGGPKVPANKGHWDDD